MPAGTSQRHRRNAYGRNRLTKSAYPGFGSIKVALVASPANRDEKTNDVAAPERGDAARYYRQKAMECIGYAAEAADRDTREQWVTLADGWTRLAMQQSR